jgi:hypothetical protein
MHERFARSEPEWDDRIEVDYVSTDGLANCSTASTTIARISPGEPLHLIEAGRDFLLDWYPARHDGVALVGPPIASLIPEIPEVEYIDEVRRYVPGLADRGSGRRRRVDRHSVVRGALDVPRLLRDPNRRKALEAGSGRPRSR